MNTIKQFFILITLFLFLGSAFAAESGAKLTFEPLYGVETTLVRYPDPHYKTRASYGARVLYGVTLFSGEVEYTQSQSKDNYPALNKEVDDKIQRASVGFRSTFPTSEFFAIYIRAGGRASQGNTKVTTSGVAENHANPLRVDPYAGAGVQIAFASNLAINAGATMIKNSEGKYDSQYTLGLSARFGNM